MVPSLIGNKVKMDETLSYDQEDALVRGQIPLYEFKVGILIIDFVIRIHMSVILYMEKEPFFSCCSQSLGSYPL